MFAVPTAFHRLSVCRLKKQPTRDDAPSKGDQPLKDDQATQGGDANSTTGDSNPKLDPTSSGTRVTSKTPLGSKGFHTLTTFKFPHSRQNSSLQSSSLCAQAKGNKEFFLADSQSNSLYSSSLFAQPQGKTKSTLPWQTGRTAAGTPQPQQRQRTLTEELLVGLQGRMPVTLAAPVNQHPQPQRYSSQQTSQQ